MRGHVDAESLALCAEGLLSRRRSERIRSHVARCPECAAAQARLTEVPALLAHIPPPPLPPGIAARLDAALSAEAVRRAAPGPRDRAGPPDGSPAARRQPRQPCPAPAQPSPAPAGRVARPLAASPGRGPGPGRGGRAGGGRRGGLRRGPFVLVPVLVRLIIRECRCAGALHCGRAESSPRHHARGARRRRRPVHRAPQRDQVSPAHLRRQGRRAGWQPPPRARTAPGKASGGLSQPGPQLGPDRVRGQGRGPGRGARRRGDAGGPGAVRGPPGHGHRGAGQPRPAGHGLRGRSPLFRL